METGMKQVDTVGGEQIQTASRYQEAGYRLPVNPAHQHAVEMIVQGCVVWDTDGIEDAPPNGEASPSPASSGMAPEATEQDRGRDKPPLANVYVDPERHTVSLLLDDETANLVVYAVRVLMAESEAHAREVRIVKATLPPDSWGAANRQVIANRHERIAGRLRVLERNYRSVVR
jgi:hypothetical protein